MRLTLTLSILWLTGCMGQYPKAYITHDTSKIYYKTYLKYQHLWDAATKTFDDHPSEKGLKLIMQYQDSCIKYVKLLQKKVKAVFVN